MTPEQAKMQALIDAEHSMVCAMHATLRAMTRDFQPESEGTAILNSASNYKVELLALVKRWSALKDQADRKVMPLEWAQMTAQESGDVS